MWARFQELPPALAFTAHSGALGDVLLCIAFSYLVISACLQLPDLPWLAAFGSMSLTLYCLHILTAGPFHKYIALESTAAAAITIAIGIGFAATWKHYRTRGPLEEAVAKLNRKVHA